MFDGVYVSKEIWDALTDRYLYIDENGKNRFEMKLNGMLFI